MHMEHKMGSNQWNIEQEKSVMQAAANNHARRLPRIPAQHM